jgi:hypothetical protein
VENPNGRCEENDMMNSFKKSKIRLHTSVI